MASNNKRREATRRQLEQRLEERQRREAARKQHRTDRSVTGTVVVIAVILILVFHFVGGDSKKKVQAGGHDVEIHPDDLDVDLGRGDTDHVHRSDRHALQGDPAQGLGGFRWVTIDNPTNLAKNPDAVSCSKLTPKKLEYKDLVVGKGKAPTAKSTVSVQYAGVFYEDGYAFDSSWKDTPGKPATFSLAQGVPGFTDAIAGSGKVPPMKIGGRRVVILPAALAYGSAGSQGIPGNTPLVFVIDLTAVK